LIARQAQIIEACEREDFGMSRFVVCGVNTTLCVLDTVKGLHALLPDARIEVVREGCNDAYCNDFSGYPKGVTVLSKKEIVLAA